MSRTTAARIDEAVQRYGRLPKDFADIHRLTYAVQFLSVELAKYANELADLFAVWRAAEFQRKAAYELERADQLNRQVPATRADAIAKNAIVEKLNIETDAEIAYKSANLRYEAAQNVLRAMQQHAATLKKEWAAS